MKRYRKNSAPGSSDIAKCDNDKCPARLDCHRYLVRPDAVMQTYITRRWGEPTGYKCPYYWPEYEEVKA